MVIAASAPGGCPSTRRSTGRPAAVSPRATRNRLHPAFHVGLFAALWIAVAGGSRSSSWRRALVGVGGVVVVQAAFGLPVDELARHYGFDPHVGLLRGWALALPAAAVWWLTRPAPVRMLVRSAPPRAVPQAG